MQVEECLRYQGRYKGKVLIHWNANEWGSTKC